MNTTMQKTDGDIDGLLSRYFKAQLPQPWPAWQAPEATSILPRRSRWLTLGRLAVAASVGIILVAYLALAGFFPRELSGRINNDPSKNIGNRPMPKMVQPNR